MVYQQSKQFYGNSKIKSILVYSTLYYTATVALETSLET